MASENMHHSSLHGADSLSYGENQPTSTTASGANPSSSSNLHTYEQRVEASGLGGERYRTGAEHPTQSAAHASLSAPGADGSRRTNPDGTFDSHGAKSREEGTVPMATTAGGSDRNGRERPVGARRVSSSGSSSASSSDGEGHARHGVHKTAAKTQKSGNGGDSKVGKVMEKVGKSVHSQKLAQKGEEKRDKAAGLQ